MHHSRRVPSFAVILLVLALAACGSALANMATAGANRQNLFITARTRAYTIDVQPELLVPSGSNAGSISALNSRTADFILTSPEVIEGGALPTEYTCDGASSTLALDWSGAPAGTVSYALIMHHVAGPMDVHWYWVLYNIPASVTSLAKNSTGVGTLGINSVNHQTAYTPPCSKGPGLKTYTYTVYALSAQPQLAVPTNKVDRDTLLAAIPGITLASAELHVTYARK